MSGSVTGSSPNWVAGYVPPASEWNSLWAAKADKASSAFIGAPFLSLAGGVMTGALTLRTGITGANEAISKSYADAHYAIAGGGGGTIIGSPGDFDVGEDLTVQGTTDLGGNTTVTGTLGVTSDFIAFGTMKSNKNALVTNGAIGSPCFAVYSGAPPGHGAGMWIDPTDALNPGALRFGETDATGAPLTEWCGFAPAAIGFRSATAVSFQMTGGAIWSGDLTNWTLTAPNAFKPGGGAWAATSDERIKRDVVNYERGLDAITALRPVRYRLRDNWSRLGQRGGKESDERDIEHIGLVAQEVEPVMPEMVGRIMADLDDIGPVSDLRTLDTTALVFALVNACKELATRVAALERPDAMGRAA